MRSQGRPGAKESRLAYTITYIHSCGERCIKLRPWTNRHFDLSFTSKIKKISKTTQEPDTFHVESFVSDVAVRNEDPHIAALEDSPDQAQRPSAGTLLAILVCHLLPFALQTLFDHAIVAALMAPAVVTMPAVLGAGLLFDIAAALGHERDSLFHAAASTSPEHFSLRMYALVTANPCRANECINNRWHQLVGD